MRCVLVSHTHWDREWYKTFQSFRARLVDTVDRILDLLESDPGFAFQLDGQTIVIEDYLEIRPGQREALEAACRAGRVAIGPWYVQPDSLIPSGETHVRNLLEGRRVAEAIGGGSTIAYTPDSFGHPGQFPQLFAGFGLGPFIYWRGNADEIATLPADYRWRAPDGSEVLACHLTRGYFSAWGLVDDVEASVKRLERLALDLAQHSERETVLLMNGLDHMLPDDNTREVAEALAKATGWTVTRGLLDDYTRDLEPGDPALPVFDGELLGGRVANLLPGVWSTHVDLKLANRRCETALQGWLEPFAVLGELVGTPDERPTLRAAWRELLPCQAHDSICGCSQDRVHVQMATRYDSVEELVGETTDRLLERIAGLGPERQVLADPETGAIRIAVFNPSPDPGSGVVRLPLAGFPAFTKRGINPVLGLNLTLEGLSVDGEPARVLPDEGTLRPMLTPTNPTHVVEFVARDVPAFGWRSYVLARAEASPDRIDDGSEIEAGSVRVRARDDGTLDVHFGDQSFAGLCGLEDQGDRGDTYDFDPVGDARVVVERTLISRRQHASGIAELDVHRVLRVPVGLDPERAVRATRTTQLSIGITARIAPGLDRVDLTVRTQNTARDHRLRILFPSGRPAQRFEASTTFDSVRRSTAPSDAAQWLHPAPATFPQQGWVHVNGLTVAAPGLLEAEVSPDGQLALTLLRAVGWLSRPDLSSRPGEAGPSLLTPGAQCLGAVETRISLFGGSVGRAVRAAELGLRVCAAGEGPLVPPDTSALEITPGDLELSAWKPAEDGAGSVLRLLNPTDASIRAQILLGRTLTESLAAVEAVRLDEHPALECEVHWQADRIEIDVPAHALRSLRLRTRARDSQA
ncbi:MAG: hypothetical protein JRG92_18655 [Deltaproteobacteria bacterium]|nr:hypothetical protein [Deltaproteobacteria bacterium]